MIDEPAQAAQVPMEELSKRPSMKKHKCKNHMLECINCMPNMTHNGSADSQYNDFILFEDTFENWDHQGILLTRWDWQPTVSEPYVYVALMGVYTDIGTFARRLQRELPHDEEIQAILIGGDVLHISTLRASYQASFTEMNQVDSNRHYDGWKFDLKPLTQEAVR